MRVTRTTFEVALALVWLAIACGDDDGASSSEGGAAGAAGAAVSEGGTADGGADGGEPMGGAAGAEATGGGGEPGTAGTANIGGSAGDAGSGQGGAPDAGAAGDDGGGTVTLVTRVDAVQGNAPFVAFQDGDAEWQGSPGGAGVYRFTPSADRYGVTVVCTRLVGQTTTVNAWVLRALASELSMLYRDCTTTATEEINLDVEVHGLRAGQSVRLSFANTILPLSFDDPMGTVPLPPGQHDGLGLTIAADGFDSVILKRDFFSSGSVSFDFDTEAVEPVTGSATVSGPGADEASVSLAVLTHRGLHLQAGSGAEYQAVPAEELEGNDVQTASAAVLSSDGQRESTAYAKDLSGTVELDLPPESPMPLVSAPSVDPYVALAVESPFQNAVQVYSFSASQLAGGSSRNWLYNTTSGWLGEGEPLAVQAPALSGLDDWDDAYGLVTGTEVSWTLTAVSSNRDVAFSLFGWRSPLDGAARSDLDGALANRAALWGTVLP